MMSITRLIARVREENDGEENDVRRRKRRHVLGEENDVTS